MTRHQFPSVYSTEAEVRSTRWQYLDHHPGNYIVFGFNEAVAESDADAFVVRHFNGWKNKFYLFGWRYRVLRNAFIKEGYPTVGPVQPAERTRVVL